MLEFILSIILQFGEPEQLGAPLPGKPIQPLDSSIFQILVDEQIVDVREVKWMIDVNVNKWSESMETIEKRYASVVACPRLEECDRFPSREDLNKSMAMNRALRSVLAERKNVDLFHLQVIDEAINECDQLYHIYDVLRDASCVYYYVPIRRESLQTFRNLIGEEAFWSGRMPPPVPVWHLPLTR